MVEKIVSNFGMNFKVNATKCFMTCVVTPDFFCPHQMVAQIWLFYLGQVMNHIVFDNQQWTISNTDNHMQNG